MNIRGVRHKGLKRFIESDDSRGIRPDMVDRVRKILTALIAARNIDAFAGPPGWRVHQLIGDRAGTWSVSVSGNWRITFAVADDDVFDLDLEDYH
jgi:proteic killer suppression protein